MFSLLTAMLDAMLDLSEALGVATGAAKAAGEVLASRFRTPLRVRTKSSPRDLVTEVDLLAQEAIVKTIRTHYPEHRFITEEEGTENLGDPASPYAWIIDPLDGTTNFIHEKPEFATMIALAERSEDPAQPLAFLLGVIHLPLLGRTFTGGKGLGALVKNEPIRLRQTRGMMDAILCTNIVARARHFPDGTLATPVLVCGSIHDYGCAAMEMGAILLGENDGVFYDGVGLWDIAAGCLLLGEAGSRYRYEFREAGNVRGGVRCVASTRPIFEELCTFLFRDAGRRNGTLPR